VSITQDWPEYGPDVKLQASITSGVMTLVGANSQLVNYADFDVADDQVVGWVVQNGTKVATLSINASTGAITMSSVNVSTGDQIIFEFKYMGLLSLDWFSRFTAMRSLIFTVPAGTSTTTFDATTNKMPVPGFDLAFGWDGNNKLKVGIAPTSTDGAGQSLNVYTRLFGGGTLDENATTVNLGNSSAQTNTSTFGKTGVPFDCEIEWYLQSGTGTTRQEERVRLTFQSMDKIPSYPASFPTSGKLLTQSKVGQGLKLM